MNISRGFLVIGSLYLLVGIVFGMYMGGTGDHSLAPLHAHINLLGFALMMIFGLVYRQFPEMTKPIPTPGFLAPRSSKSAFRLLAPTIKRPAGMQRAANKPAHALV